MVNVVVSRKRNVRVSTNATAGIIDTSVPVTLKNVPSLTTGTSRLDHLIDVDATHEQAGSTLIYEPTNDTYVVKQLDLANVTGSLDGGEF